MRVMGITCTVEGDVSEVGVRGLAVVSNHLSYLDILVCSSIRPFVMVSKTEVRRWPLLGWITAQAGTVYVERSDVEGGQKQTHAEVNSMMAQAFRSGLPVLFFPEGTTTGGETVLPFRRGLFHSVLEDQVPVQTAAMVYELDPRDVFASVAEDVCFVGDAEFGPHLFRALGLRQVKVRIRFSPQQTRGEDRFALAMNARDAVVSMYEELSGAHSIPQQVSFPSQERVPVSDSRVEQIDSGLVGQGA
jgi:1-acyl-sn-glycerol-3-phosphate acyltransferase